MLKQYDVNNSEIMIEEDCDHEEDGESIDYQEDISLRRGPGRPRIVRTGIRGRPKKSYNMIVPEESGMLAEVSIKEAIKGPDVDEWYSAMATELRSITRGTLKILSKGKKKTSYLSKNGFIVSRNILHGRQYTFSYEETNH